MSADSWGHEVCRLAIELKGRRHPGLEDNFGGDTAKQIITQAWRDLQHDGQAKGLLMPNVIEIHAKQGKRLKVEPIAQIYAQGLVYHLGEFPHFEGQLVIWIPGMDFPRSHRRRGARAHQAGYPRCGGDRHTSYADHRLSGHR
ncbi:hypothetical protein [Streptomyces javensis]|uniref:Uncharacterized protein n=1 Tax=Streptomyces javensis TaxID=114698 RepID=A0ABS0RCW1_9ACTN|nr:hypothetical protein [Streptomyces javensis]MBI0315251.1 hypothetical protein [Streptomyces javensis]